MLLPLRPVLGTARLVLVPQTVGAARALLEGRDAGFPLAHGYPHADSFAALRMQLASRPGGIVSGWFVTLRETGAAIGDCGTKGGVDDQGRVEIGYGLAPPWRGQGLGTEAVGALVAWLHAQPEVRRIDAEVEVGNVASRRLLERLDFVVADRHGGSWWLHLPSDEAAHSAEHRRPRR